MEYKHTVMIVDDTPSNIDLLKNVLQQQYRIKAAPSGVQALKVLEHSSDVDIVLLDIMMPEMDGYEVIRRLKSNPHTAAIPVIFISAKGETVDQTRGFELGAADYIIKPITPPVVLARVATHVALNERRKYLEARVAEEVEKRLAQERMLLRQSRLAAMGEMMRAITHQWSQPLSIISMVATNIRMDIDLGELDQAELSRHIDQIASSVAFMSQTISDFKNYMKHDKQKVIFLLADAVHEVVSLLQPMLQAQGISVQISLENGMRLFGVPSEFKQVLLNLISNAKDAIEERRTMGAVDTAGLIVIAGTTEGSIHQLEVSDNGCGFPEGLAEEIFAEYFTTKKEYGTGIGLAMSKWIVEDAFGGEISARNNDQGATFCIKLPSA